MAQTPPLTYTVAPLHSGHPGPHPLLVLLHGRGSDENDLLGLAPLLDPRFLLVSVRAPRRFMGGGYTWYDFEEIGKPNGSQLVESLHQLTQLLDGLPREHPADPSRVFLFGFSMGAMMAFTMALTHPERVRGIVAHSGYLPEHVPLAYQWNALGRTAFFIAHGTKDPIVPIQMGRRSADLLRPTGAPVEFHEYPIPHTISEESLSDLSRWLSSRLDDR